ncbi:pumilio homology domain family member 6 [[Candida] railenensis]|uniref:Pumilio homology domain family member 6 n=1 Tax=[Candida] railenensis TaxID=45579 RepID=A0A9P0QVV4_9ASCO|nr:pumilio homology domain family member 6 [[Candida] railenensis]
MGSKDRGTKRSAPQQKNGAAVPVKKTKVAPKKEIIPESSSEEEDDEEDEEMDDVSSSDDLSDSEDELDELDELDDTESKVTSVAESASESDSDSDSDSETGSDSESTKESGAASSEDPNKKSSKEQHAEQRKVLAERKLQRKSGQEVQQIKNLWEKLRVKKPTPPKQVRDKLCDEIWNLSKDCILDLVMKHDASRVVQTLVKFASKERRDIVVSSLKGNYYTLATSSYGKYLLVKLLHYGSKESRTLIVNELHGKLRKLMRHREGAYVVEDLFVLYSTAEQRQQMIREFWGSEYAVFRDSGKGKTILDIVAESSEKKHLIMTNLIGTITASIEKGSTGFQILHAAMKDYVTVLLSDPAAHDKELREFIELLTEQFAELVHTQEGSEVACQLISVANAKERKLIVRGLKSHAKELIKNDNGNLVLITLFMTVDDTVMLHKSFSTELFTNELLPNLISEKFSRRPLLYLLKGLDGKYFAPVVTKPLKAYETLAYNTTTKKPQEQRRLEILDRALPLIYQSILALEEHDLITLLSVNIAAQFITELILTPTTVEEVNTKLRPELLALLFKLSVQGDILEDFHLINKVPFITRSLKALIQGNEFKWDNESKKLILIEDNEKISGAGLEFATKVTEEILSDSKTLDNWVANGQGSFVIVSVYEVLQLSTTEQQKFKELQKALKKVKKNLVKDTDNKGAQLLAKLI